MVQSMNEYNKLKKLIRTNFDYSLICDEVDKYLENNDQKFLEKYQNNSIIYIDLVKEQTMSIVFMLLDRLGTKPLISKERYQKYSDMQVYILKNYTLALKQLSNYCKEDGVENFGMGFFYFTHEFSEPSVLGYFAKYFLTNLFTINKSTFFESVIRRFPEKNKLTSYGVKRYMIEYIGMYDSELVDYVIANPKLLDGYLKKINVDDVYNSGDSIENTRLKFIYDSSVETFMEQAKLLKKYSKFINPAIKEKINSMTQQLNLDLKAEELCYYYLLRENNYFGPFELSEKEQKILFQRLFNTFPANMYGDKKLSIDEKNFSYRRCLDMLDKMLTGNKNNSEKTKVKKLNE